jgi:hypothetical protein
MELEAGVARCNIVLSAAHCRGLIADLRSRLNTNCAAKDGLLYPQLQEFAGAADRALAKRFEEEMACLMQVFRDYARRWLETDAIETRPTDFKMTTRDITTSMIERIRLENEQLLPLMDGVCGRNQIRDRRSALVERARLSSLPLMYASGV